MSLSSLHSQTKHYHMQTHVEIKTDLNDSPVLRNYKFPREARGKYLNFTLLSPHYYPTEKSPDAFFSPPSCAE